MIDVVDVPVGTHVCGFYGSRHELTETVVPYFAAGLSQNELCIWVTGPAFDVQTAKSHLQAIVPSLNHYLDSGQMEIHDYRDWYLGSGSFDADRVTGLWGEGEKRALGRGFRGMRASGDLAWLDEKIWPHFMDYEAVVNREFCKRQVKALCTYSTEHCEGGSVLDVVQRHHSALARIDEDWRLVPSHTHGMQSPLSSQIQDLSAHLVQAQEEERRRIATQLLDVTAQDLFAISIHLSVLQSLVEIPGVGSSLANCRILCDRNVNVIRALSQLLFPPLLDRFGLACALESFTKEFSKRDGASVELEIAPGMERLPLNIETSLFRIVEEGLTSILSVSQNPKTVVRLSSHDSVVTLEIEDSGRGLPASAMLAISGGVGNLGMSALGLRERMRQVGGSFHIQFGHDGTTLTAKVPVPVKAS